MKKIAIVSDAVYPYNKGGKEIRLYEISTRLAAQGHDVTIYCMNWWRGETIRKQDGVALHAISPYYPLYAGERRSIKEAIFFALHCFKLLDKPFDVIEADHMPHLVLFTVKLVCLLRRKQLIVTWNEVWGRAYWKNYMGGFFGPLFAEIAWIIERLSVALPDRIVSISPHTTNALRAVLGARQEILTVPIGVDSEAILLITPATRRSDIIFAGRLLSHKNVDVLLEAVSIIAKRQPDITAIIVGDGPERRNLELLTRKLHIQRNVAFLGFVEDHNDLYALMQASRVFVLPSTREGFGIVAIEANACGLPIIAIDHEQNATKELIIHGENGALTSLEPRQLAETIEHLLDDEQNPDRYIRHAQKYNWKNIISKIEIIYTL